MHSRRSCFCPLWGSLMITFNEWLFQHFDCELQRNLLNDSNVQMDETTRQTIFDPLWDTLSEHFWNSYFELRECTKETLDPDLALW